MAQESGYTPSMDELHVKGRMEADKNFITDSKSENFGRIKDTAEMEDAADQVNANIDAGRPENFTIVGEGTSPYAEQMGRKVAGPEASAQEIKVAAHGAEVQKRHIEEHQRLTNEAIEKQRQAISEDNG